uniref:Uncharacterized protein n=1 Tax=Anopheles minimus TaxID=112268 RepID=A0A182W206_9DIPT
MTPELCLVEAHFVQLYEPIRSYTEPDPHNRSVVVAMSIGAFGNVEHGLLAGKLRNVVLLGLISKLTIRFAVNRLLYGRVPMFNVSTILRFSIQSLLLWCFIGNVVWSAYGSKRINGVFWIHSKDGELQTALYNNTLNVCEFLEHPTRNRLLHYILLEIKQRSNLPTKCPIRPGTYYIRNATFERTRVPSFLPASYFRVDINLLDGNPSKMLLTSRWYGQLIKV